VLYLSVRHSYLKPSFLNIKNFIMRLTKMSSNKKLNTAPVKISLQLLALLLLGSLVMTQNVGTGSWWKVGGTIPTTPDTWWKTGAILVSDTPYSINEADANSLGYGLISTPLSLGTDNFSIVSGPCYIKDTGAVG
jgi:hypothetical protein